MLHNDLIVWWVSDVLNFRVLEWGGQYVIITTIVDGYDAIGFSKRAGF